MEEEKRVPNYNPKEDDKEYIGTKLLDGIERGASSWYKDERTLEGWEYLNPLSVATAGAIRGVEGVGWVLGNTPVAGDLLRGIGWAEDRLAEGARNVSGALTPDLDPRFAGWGTRLGTAILADKGIRKVAGATKATLKEGAERAAVRSGKKYTSTRPETMSDIWKNEDITGPRKTFERTNKKRYYRETPLSDLWDDTPEMTKPQSTAYGDDLSVVPTDDLRGLEKVSQATGEPIDVIALREGLLNRIDNQGDLFDDTVDLSVTQTPAPLPKWGPDATREAARQLFRGNPRQAREYFTATLAKKSGYESLKEFKRQILDQMPDKGEQIFRLLNESEYREGMVEHIVAKGKYMDWYWEGLGKGDRHALTNVRLLYNDRFDKFKTTVEGIVRRTYQRTPKLEDRLIVGIENVGKSSKKVSGILIQDVRNPGNIVIKRAGSGKVIGQLGQYLDALYPQDRALRAELLYQLQLRGIKGTKAVSQWRKKILEERLTKIVDKAHKLPKSDKQARIIIQDAIEEDMIKFREEYDWLPQQKKLKFQDEPVVQPKTRQLGLSTKTEDLNPPGRGKSIPKSG